MSHSALLTPSGRAARASVSSTSLRAVAYIRGVDASSPAIQSRLIREYCQSRGLIIDSTVLERNSEAALPPDRRELWANLIARPPQHLVIQNTRVISAKPSAARDQLQALLEHEMTIHLADESGCALRSDTDLGRHLILTALTLADTFMAPPQTPKPSSNIPIGFKLTRSGKVVPCPEEMRFLHELRELHEPEARWVDTAMTLNPTGKSRFRNRLITGNYCRVLLNEFNSILAAASHNNTIASALVHAQPETTTNHSLETATAEEQVLYDDRSDSECEADRT